MNKYLVHFAQSDDEFTEGERYLIVDESDDMYWVDDDNGELNGFTKEPDEDGASYATWFRLDSGPAKLARVALTYDDGAVIELADKVAVLLDVSDDDGVSVDFETIGISDERLEVLAAVIADSDIEVTPSNEYLGGGDAPLT
jgi:hypothetical protein